MVLCVNSVFPGEMSMIIVPRYVRRNGMVHPTATCLLCGVYYGELRPERACPVSICLACGSPQCLYNGLGRGQCSICLCGLLDGYSVRMCGYTHCGKSAILAAPRVKYACRDHAIQKRLLLSVEKSLSERDRLWILKP